jgi:chemotaxis protein CheY-P-specific phosphatase CheC
MMARTRILSQITSVPPVLLHFQVPSLILVSHQTVDEDWRRIGVDNEGDLRSLGNISIERVSSALSVHVQTHFGVESPEVLRHPSEQMV